MDRNKKIIIGGIAFVVIMLIIIFVVWFLNVDQPSQTQTNTNLVPNEVRRLPATVSPSDSTVLEAEIEEPGTEATLRSVARTFAERFGSFSNQSNFTNLEDLESIMTIKMKGWAQGFIQDQAGNSGDESVYYGITTISVSSKILEFDGNLNRAEVLVSTQRQESKGSTINPKVFYQDIKLKLVKDAVGWKVDEAYWQ